MRATGAWRTPTWRRSERLPVLRQLALELPHSGSTGRDDLVCGRANALAIDLVDRWPDWPGSLVALVGPPGCGKSHIAAAWAGASGAATISACDLDAAAPPPAKNVVVEDAGPGTVPERALFHLLNNVRAEGGHCLVTSRWTPSEWKVGLPDLASRLRAAQFVEIGEPDDRLLSAVIVKLFADRQIEAPPAAVEYMVARMERSLATAGILVAAIDAEALARKSRVTRPLVAQVMAAMENLTGEDRQSRFDFDTRQG